MEKLLITKLVRNDTGADLYARGHRWPDLKLFDLSDLALVGIDFETLPEGEETPCRFWAYYELAEKLNKAGNPYKNVVMLEPIDKPASAASTDNTALLAELRAIRALLSAWLQTQGLPIPTDDTDQDSDPLGPPSAGSASTAPASTADLDDYFPRDDAPPAPDPSPSTAPAPVAAPKPTNGDAEPSPVPVSPIALVAHLQKAGITTYDTPRDLYFALDLDRWPPAGDTDAWTAILEKALPA